MALQLADLIADREDWLIRRVLSYARTQGFTKYTSTLEAGWRMSIAGLSAPLIALLREGREIPGFTPDEDYAHDPVSAFGVLEAQRHRVRGVTLGMFLGLMKYYRLTYRDLVCEAGYPGDQRDRYLDLITRYFDRIELGFCSEWAGENEARIDAELRATNRRMTNEKNLYLTIFESMPTPVIFFGATHEVEQVNYAAQVLLAGLSVPGIAYYGDEPWRDKLAWLRDHLMPLLSDLREAHTLDFEHDTGDGTHTFQITLKPMLDVSGKFEGTVVILVDLTDRHRAEEERRELEARILHAQKLESLGVLAGGIAHDFNNLLMGVLGNASIALEVLGPESPARRPVTQVETAARRAADLAQQMLAYSGKGRLATEPLDISALVEEMAHLLSVAIGKKVVLKYALAPGLPAVEGDPTQLRQVVMNLITNASEAVGDRSGFIMVSTGLLECTDEYLAGMHIDDALAPGYYVFIEVSDTGCGMDRPTQERIFDPFFTTKFTGRGLGLAAVQGIVRGHLGALKVYSEVDHGTTIKVLLPCSPSATFAQQTPAGGAWHGTGTVLVVDDEETVRSVAGAMLEHLGFAVLTANDGREALDVLRAHGGDIDLVLLDMTMPHMSGEETYRAIRQTRPDLRVILSSGYNATEATHHFAGKGLAGFLQKPYTLAVLAEAIRAALGVEA